MRNLRFIDPRDQRQQTAFDPPKRGNESENVTNDESPETWPGLCFIAVFLLSVCWSVVLVCFGMSCCIVVLVFDVCFFFFVCVCACLCCVVFLEVC